MIAKAKSIRHLSASINYALSREQAVVLDKNIVAQTPTEVAQEFQVFQALNQRCARNSLSFVISPTIKDGQDLSQEQLVSINQAFLKQMNLQEHQYIAFVHDNTQHKHIHLYVNRIDQQGRAYNDQFISNRAARAAEGIAQQMGLQTAKAVQQVKHTEKKRQHPEMKAIQALAQKSLDKPAVSTVAQFVEVFNKAGAAQGLRAEAYCNQQGALQGLRFYAGQQRFKASEIDRSLAKQALERQLQGQARRQVEQGQVQRLVITEYPQQAVAHRQQEMQRQGQEAKYLSVHGTLSAAKEAWLRRALAPVGPRAEVTLLMRPQVAKQVGALLQARGLDYRVLPPEKYTQGPGQVNGYMPSFLAVLHEINKAAAYNPSMEMEEESEEEKRRKRKRPAFELSR